MLLTFDQIQGQSTALTELQQRLQAGTFRGSFLFTGPEGVGKKTTALALTAALFCEAKPLSGCGTCSICTQIAAGTHPDLNLVEPEATDSIKIETARKLIRRLSLQAAQASHKIALIDRAETLTTEATNALLKCVEEPGATSIFIFISSAPGRLLPTLRSRCQPMAFRPLAADILETLLREQEPEWSDTRIHEVIGLAEGSLTQAQRFGTWFEEQELDLPRLFFQLGTQNYSQWQPKLADLPSDGPGVTGLLGGLQAVCRDLLIAAEVTTDQSDETPLLFANSNKLYQNLSCTRDAIFACVTALNQAEQARHRHVSSALLWESLAFSFQKVLQRSHAA